MKPKVLLIIGMILLTNILTFAIVKVYFPTNVNNNYYLLKMKGQGEHWLITDYQIAWISGKGSMEGSETVTYLDNPNDLIDVVTIEVYDYFKDGTVPHGKYTTTATSLRDGSFTAGGGGGSPDEDLSVMEIVNSTKILVRWTTKDGMEHEETIIMELDYSPPILSHVI